MSRASHQNCCWALKRASELSPRVSTVYCICPATWLCDPSVRFSLSHVLLPYLLASGPAPQPVYQYSLNPRLCQTLDVCEQIKTQWGENWNLQDSLCTYLRLHHSLSWLAITYSQSVRNVGFLFDTSLSFDNPVNSVCKSIFLELRKICLLWHLLSVPSTHHTASFPTALVSCEAYQASKGFVNSLC